MAMRDWTGWILLLAALAVGAAAFFLIQGYLSEQEEQIRLSIMRQQGDSGRILVASKDLQAGEVVSSATVAIGEIPTEHVAGRVLTPADFESIQGRVISRTMSSGEPLLADFVAGYLVERFSDLVEEGQRAVSLEVATLQTHAGMLLPGDYVDLFVMLDEEPSRGPAGVRLEPVLERVKVLAAGPQPLRTRDQAFQRLLEREARYSQITVGVSLANAKQLVKARQLGELVYFLRNARDQNSQLELGEGLFEADAGGRYVYVSPGEPDGRQRRAQKPWSEH